MLFNVKKQNKTKKNSLKFCVHDNQRLLRTFVACRFFSARKWTARIMWWDQKLQFETHSMCEYLSETVESTFSFRIGRKIGKLIYISRPLNWFKYMVNTSNLKTLFYRKQNQSNHIINASDQSVSSYLYQKCLTCWLRTVKLKCIVAFIAMVIQTSSNIWWASTRCQSEWASYEESVLAFSKILNRIST